ncbi:MAG: ABC transporter ATP-binding protein [Candidatus Aminicenantes bacterium]|nr:ABC transporter ATP-binding protein [Candidatus Aminicenantes bacterium]
MPNNVIWTKNLKKSYPLIKSYRDLIRHPFQRNFIQALRGIDIAVPPQTCFCLVGPNGAGKTTLIKILTTLVLPNEGEAFILGHDVVREEALVKRLVGLAIAEERSFYWRLTGRQNLEFFAALYGFPHQEAKKRIEEVLELVGLTRDADKRFNTYSSGMRQLLGLARALLPEVEVIFVDEPTRSLDPQMAEKIRKFLRQELVDRQGKTVFWASHNLAEVEAYGQEVAIISKGKIQLQGRIKDLTDNGQRSLFKIYQQYVQPNGEELSGLDGRN